MSAGGSVQLQPGHPITLLQSGLHGRVENFLGAGGQGSVYLADFGGRRLAYKMYHPHTLTNDERVIVRLRLAMEAGRPDGRYLWPIDLAQAAGRGELGYVMPLRDRRFRNMRDIIAAPPNRMTPSMRASATACLRLADSFLHLHARGLCYQDINFGNIFLDPETGDIAICDNDNTDVNGAPAAVYGTRKFMAPEIVRREALPSTQTDLYSLAVMMFYIMLAWHPLDGKAEAEIAVLDGDAEFALYGANPRFLFDSADTSNGPLAGMHEPIERRWRALSAGTRALFTRAFTAGLSAAPGKRVLETEWRDGFARLRDSVVTCPACGMEHATDAEDADPAAERFACIGCGGAISMPLMLGFGRDRVALHNGAGLYPHHLDPARRFDYSLVLGRVEVHPADPALFGLRNLGEAAWSAAFADGQTAIVAPGRAMRLAPGMKVQFGLKAGVIDFPWKLAVSR
jgi:eukaryotic-like serine/threonine-protein kinase